MAAAAAVRDGSASERAVQRHADSGVTGQLGKNGIGTLSAQRLSELATQRFVVSRVAPQFGADHFLAIGRRDETAQPEPAVFDDRVTTQRYLARAAKGAGKGTSARR